MCGISGYSGVSIPGVLNQMMDSLEHRGPDDRGVYQDANMNLGMVRLSIIDLKTGRQPITNEDGTLWVIFNGEIYNYVELREELESKGHHFKTRSDTETIVHAYEEYGSSFGHRFNGMFAIALWDSRSRTLTLMRDRFGVKPLFYTKVSDTIIFGSEIKAILSHPLVNWTLDDEALSHYFSLRNIPSPFTIYKNIRSLPPGHMLIWSEQGMKISRWYELNIMPQWQETDENVLIERIDALLRDSVRLRLRSDVSYGAYLSGGVDSSTVVAMMSEFAPKPVKTFSLSYADSPSHKQDASYARLIARRYGTDHHEYVMSWSDLKKDLETVVRHLDQPFAGVLSSFWLTRFMRSHVTVALSGDGGDDIFGSYGHHRLVGPMAAIQKILKEGGSPDDVDFGFFRDRKDWVLNLAGMSPWEWRLSYAAFMEHEKYEFLSDKGRERFMPYSTSGFLREIYQQTDGKADELNRMLYLDIHTLLPNEILYYNDMLSMAHSMEVRTPFLDFRLVELAASIPGSLKIRQGILKYILRRAASRYVPQEILDRPKEGFVLPKNTWLRQGMASFVKEVLSPERLKTHDFLNERYVKTLVQSFMAGDESLTFRIWTLLVFQLWYENFSRKSDHERIDREYCLRK